MEIKKTLLYKIWNRGERLGHIYEEKDVVKRETLLSTRKYMQL